MKILLVDEDPVLLEALASAVSGGIDTLDLVTAKSATEAFEAVAEFEELDALITAALMAPQDGFHLAAALRARFPELRIAYLSKLDLTRHYGKVGSDSVFYKPVNTAVIVDWVKGSSVSAPAGPTSETPEKAQRPEESRKGIRIGDYDLLRLLSETEQTETYEAVQGSVQRHVAFTLLRDEVRVNSPDAVKAFIEEVRAKASVMHQHIAPVYEAREENEALFYTRELVLGRRLDNLKRSGGGLAAGMLVGLIRAVADSFSYLNEQKKPYAELLPSHVFLGHDQQTRLVNLAVLGDAGDQSSEADQIRRFVGMVESLVKAKESGKARKLVSHLLVMMAHEKDDHVNGSWEKLRVAAGRVAAEVERESASELPDIERRTRIAAVKKRMVRAAFVLGCLIIVFVIAIGALKGLGRYIGRPDAKAFDEMVRIPGGRFQYQDGEVPVELEAFWIDEYEVTIGQYDAFLKSLEEEGGYSGRFDHDEQPESKTSHEPTEWRQYYAAARTGGFFKGQPVDLNCPVTLVDWWDAYAYANWKARRLPTEQEWEKAARGRSGAIYPWGDEFVASNLNSSKDYTEDLNDESAGTYDGYVFWSQVDAIKGDISQYLVKGMAGNVSEWTASWDYHVEFPDRLVPVKRGGSFATRTGYELHRRRSANSPEERMITVGFRTASSNRPPENPDN